MSTLRLPVAGPRASSREDATLLGSPGRATARPKPPLIVAAALAAASLLAGCKGSDTPSPAAAAPSTPPTTAVTTPTTALTATTRLVTDEDRIRETYRDFWMAWERANDPPNPDHPDLLRIYDGEALNNARRAISESKGRNERTVRPPNSRTSHNIQVTSVDRDKATVEDCSFDDLQVVNSSGQVINGETATELWSASLVKKGDQWTVTFNEMKQKWQGEPGCALS